MNTKMYLACLTAIALSLPACIAASPDDGAFDDGEDVGDAAQASTIEHVQNPDLDFPLGITTAQKVNFMRSTFELPETDGSPSHPFFLVGDPSGTNRFYGQLNYEQGALGQENLLVRHLPGKVLLSSSHGVRGGLVQPFVWAGGSDVYQSSDPDLGPTGPDLVVRVKREAGSLIAQLLKRSVNGTPGATCTLIIDASNAPQGEWVDLSKPCMQTDEVDPFPGDPFYQVTIQTFGDGVGLVDRLSVTKDVAPPVQPPGGDP